MYVFPNLERNLLVWEIYFYWLISRSSLQSLIPLVLQPTFLIKDVMLVLCFTVIKITYRSNGQLIWLEATLRRSVLAD